MTHPQIITITATAVLLIATVAAPAGAQGTSQTLPAMQVAVSRSHDFYSSCDYLYEIRPTAKYAPSHLPADLIRKVRTCIRHSKKYSSTMFYIELNDRANSTTQGWATTVFDEFIHAGCKDGAALKTSWWDGKGCYVIQDPQSTVQDNYLWIHGPYAG